MYNFTTKEPTLSVIILRDFVTSDYHMFPVLNQNFGHHKFKDDCQGETVVTLWQTMTDMDCYQKRTEKIVLQHKQFLSRCWDYVEKLYDTSTTLT
jgi:hypothetical protein